MRLLFFITFSFLCLNSFSQVENYQEIAQVMEKICKKEKLSVTEMSSFLCAYENKYMSNVELGEYRNEALFQIIASDNVSLFLSLLKKESEDKISRVFSDLRNPIHDTIDSEVCLKYLYSTKRNNKLRKRIIRILER
ncbi:hypothetical protein [Bacteroides rodentium]|uniref:hypothetical protein n=1 Tax=Bacteroides rodentium TaxID=691816 RepID=UPI00046E9320|nr:hypothetical protein [Bacteroides rodentium]